MWRVGISRDSIRAFFQSSVPAASIKDNSKTAEKTTVENEKAKEDPAKKVEIDEDPK